MELTDADLGRIILSFTKPHTTLDLLRAVIAADRAARGEVVVTKNESGQIVAVTRQDGQGQILSIISEAAQPEPLFAELIAKHKGLAEELAEYGYEAPASPPVCKPMTTVQMEKGRTQIFSVGNPFCPCDSKTFMKVARYVESFHDIKDAHEK